ncbi:DUF3068 domain-containing protein [Planomonospora sp. ID67723]|uniref:DUF3068 domain-containing protein n=1 Tax=Planomonospora sp. ID67723 TaxID=2738134 RepID=UPI0018C41C99|nr:DUF3068 domain-containing protein [Planomonospora sp. ID67723]MBG0828137.1 DUF3068 domain-containing protein [Planomonospora sp. ID67723]
MTGARVPWTALLAVGAFLLTFAGLLRFQVYESVLVLPLEQNRTYRMTAQNGTYFDTGTLVTRAGVPLVSTTTLRGDVGAGREDVAVWMEFTSLDTGGGRRIDYHERRTAFDRRTGLAVDCCGGYVDGDARPRQTGLAFRLPFRAEPRSYPMYDTVLHREVLLRFEREEDIRGVRTYRYGYTLGPVRVEETPMEFPGRALGLPERRTVGAARYAEVTRTLWVEPESGLTVKAEERHRQTLRTADGAERRVSLQADLVMSPEDTASAIAEAQAFVRWTLAVRDVLPGALCMLAAALGLLAVRLRGPGPAGRRPAGQQVQTAETETV